MIEKIMIMLAVGVTAVILTVVQSIRCKTMVNKCIFQSPDNSSMIDYCLHASKASRKRLRSDLIMSLAKEYMLKMYLYRDMHLTDNARKELDTFFKSVPVDDIKHKSYQNTLLFYTISAARLNIMSDANQSRLIVGTNHNRQLNRTETIY